MKLPSVVQELLRVSDHRAVLHTSTPRQTTSDAAKPLLPSGGLQLPPLHIENLPQGSDTSYCSGASLHRFATCSPSSSAMPTIISRSNTPVSSSSPSTPSLSPAYARQSLTTHYLPQSPMLLVKGEGRSPLLMSILDDPEGSKIVKPILNLPQHATRYDNQTSMMHVVQKTDAFQKITEHTRDWTPDQLYDAVFQLHTGPGYGNGGRTRPKEQEAKPMPLREDYTSQSAYEAKHKEWYRNDDHRLKEKARRDRHFELQVLLDCMVCGLAKMLSQEDPILVGARKKHRTNTGYAKPGKDDQFLGSLYQNVLTLLVTQSEHKGRLAAEAIATEERSMRLQAETELENYRLKYGGLGDDESDDYAIISSNSFKPSSLKRRRANQSGRHSKASRLMPSLSPSPSVSFSYRGHDSETWTVVNPPQTP